MSVVLAPGSLARVVAEPETQRCAKSYCIAKGERGDEVRSIGLTAPSSKAARVSIGALVAYAAAVGSAALRGDLLALDIEEASRQLIPSWQQAIQKLAFATVDDGAS